MVYILFISFDLVNQFGSASGVASGAAEGGVSEPQ